jgi:hypothetical protein
MTNEAVTGSAGEDGGRAMTDEQVTVPAAGTIPVNDAEELINLIGRRWTWASLTLATMQAPIYGGLPECSEFTPAPWLEIQEAAEELVTSAAELAKMAADRAEFLTNGPAEQEAEDAP